MSLELLLPKAIHLSTLISRNYLFAASCTYSPGIIWMDLEKIATKGFSSELSSTRSHKPQKKNPPKSTLQNILNFRVSYYAYKNAVRRKWKKDILPQQIDEWIFSMLLWTPQENAFAQKTFCCIFVSLGPRFGL